MAKTMWTVAIKRADTGAVELVMQGQYIDPTDQQYEFDVHVVPCEMVPSNRYVCPCGGQFAEALGERGCPQCKGTHKAKLEGFDDYHFGSHTFERGCYCHPEVREKIHGRNMIIHSDKVM